MEHTLSAGTCMKNITSVILFHVKNTSPIYLAVFDATRYFEVCSLASTAVLVIF